MNDLNNREEAYTLLSELNNSSELTQRELSLKLNVSLGKVNYLLKELIHRGWISVVNFSTKPQKIKKVRYALTKKGFRARVDLLQYYMQKKEKEYMRLKEEWALLSKLKEPAQGEDEHS